VSESLAGAPTPLPDPFGTPSKREISRLVRGLDALLHVPSFKDFRVEVDLERDDWGLAYLMTIPYPIFLDRIRRRLHNAFYRQICAIVWDINTLLANTIAFNEDGSEIVAHANTLCRAFREFVADPTCKDIEQKLPGLRQMQTAAAEDPATPSPRIARLAAAKRNRNDDVETAPRILLRHAPAPVAASPKRARHGSAAGKRKGGKAHVAGRAVFSGKRKKVGGHPEDKAAQEEEEEEAEGDTAAGWERDIIVMHNHLMAVEGAADIFNEPVDLEMYPEYANVIQHPMDFGTILERLHTHAYGVVDEYVADVQLVFANARRFNIDNDPILKLTAVMEALFTSSLEKLNMDTLRHAARFRGETRITAELRQLLLNAHQQLMLRAEARPFVECLAEQKKFSDRPMDLMTALDRLEEGRYKTVKGYAAETARTFCNVLTTAKPTDPMFIDATGLLNQFLGSIQTTTGLAVPVSAADRGLGHLGIPLEPISRRVVTLHKSLMAEADAAIFNEPVDKSYADYYATIARPMDFGTVLARLQGAEPLYHTLGDYAADVRLVLTNARNFNTPGSALYAAASRLLLLWEPRLQLLATREKSKAPPAEGLSSIGTTRVSRRTRELGKRSR